MTDQIPWSWQKAIEYADLPPMTKLALFVINNYLNNFGDYASHPHITQIAKGMGVHTQTAIKYIDIAVEHGWLEPTNLHDDETGEYLRLAYLPGWPDHPSAEGGQ